MSTRVQNSRVNNTLSRVQATSNSRIPSDSTTTFTAPAIGATVTLASLGIAGTGRGTYVFAGTIANAGDGVSERIFFQLDDGTDSNRFYARNPAASEGLTLVRILASAAATANTGLLTDAVAFTLAVAILGDGTARASFDGGAVVSVSGGPTFGLTTLRFGTNAAGASSLSGLGTIASLVVRRGVAVADAALQALSA